MGFEHTELRFPSSDGVHNIYAELYVPKDIEPKGIIQLVHGMVDHTGRYGELAEYMCDEGYIFAGHHHLGHGKSVDSEEDFGFFADKGGKELVVEDVRNMNRLLHERFPTLPIVILGHSMGSFITRLYLTKYPDTVKAAVIHGTAGPNRILPLGKALGWANKLFMGKRHRSRLLYLLTTGGYSKKFPKEEGERAWLSSDIDAVSGDDPLTSFTFTSSAYCDLFSMLGECNGRRWFREYPKELPTLIVSGDCDPVGAFGRGPGYVYKKLSLAGCNRVTLKMYEGARHELFNEKCRREVFEYLSAWIGGAVK